MDSRRSSYVRKIRRKGKYKWALCYVGLDGRRHTEVTRATTRVAAQGLLNKRLNDLSHQEATGITITTGMSFEDFAKKYIVHQKAILVPKSAERIGYMVEKLFNPRFGKRKLTDLRPRDFQEYINERLCKVYKRQDGTTKKISPCTVDREYQTLKGLYSLAIEWDYAVVNPLKKVRLKKYEWRKQRILTKDEEKKLFAAFEEGDRRGYLTDVVTVALHTGMREDEILRLKWEDIDLPGKKITVRSTHETPTKGKRTRVIKMSTRVSSALAALYMAAQKKAAEAKREGKKGLETNVREQYVFVNPRTGTRFQDTHMAWYASLRDAEITGLRFHDLRHTFATRAILGGCKLPALQQVLGHQDITTTMRYVHMLGLEIDNVVDCVEKFDQGDSDDADEDQAADAVAEAK